MTLTNNMTDHYRAEYRRLAIAELDANIRAMEADTPAAVQVATPEAWLKSHECNAAWLRWSESLPPKDVATLTEIQRVQAAMTLAEDQSNGVVGS